MDSLEGTSWDVVIDGTGLPQSLLALALSRSGKRILHVDRNDYYGGAEAAFSLDEANRWAERYASTTANSGTRFSHASISRHEQPGAAIAGDGPRLANSRAYSLTLSPHLLYARSRLIDAIVSSQIHNQLDFQAVGAFFVLNPRPATFTLTRLVKVPSGREDVFADSAIGLKEKRALMKFLRFVNSSTASNVVTDEAEVSGSSSSASGDTITPAWHEGVDTPFPQFLQQKFGIPPSAHSPILALTLSPYPPERTTTDFALRRISRHVSSLGAFGPGFAAVLPKWGGLGEIVQVACRACAVGGGVYVLGQGVKGIGKRHAEHGDTSRLAIELSEGEKVNTQWLVDEIDDIPEHTAREYCQDQQDRTEVAATARSISVISSPLPTLFPPTAEGGPTPAGAVIVVPSQNIDEPPVHILAHTSEAGECPRDQCVLYASVPATIGNPALSFARLQTAVQSLLDDVGFHYTINAAKTSAEITSDANVEDLAKDALPKDSPVVLWQMQYLQHTPTTHNGLNDQSHQGQDDVTSGNVKGVCVLPGLSQDVALDDEALASVETVWRQIVGNDTDNAQFLTFESREARNLDEED